VNAQRKILMLTSLLALSLTAIIGLAIYVWHLHQDLQQLKQPNSLTSIQSQTIQQHDIFGNDNDLFQLHRDPFTNMQEMQQRIDKMFESMQSSSGIMHSFSTNTPEITLEEDQQEYRAIITTQEGQNIELEAEVIDRRLQLNGTIKNEEKANQANGFQSFRSSSQFSQSVSLSQPVDANKITIEYQKNQMVVHVPKV